MKRAISIIGAVVALNLNSFANATTQEAAGVSAAKRQIWVCNYNWDGSRWLVAAFISDLNEREIDKELVKVSNSGARRCFTSGDEWKQNFPQANNVDEALVQLKMKMSTGNNVLTDWAPTGRNSLSSERRTKEVFFKAPSGTQKGYSGVKFDIEYQFIVCDREVHIAYSVLPNSARVHNGGIPTYWWGGPDKYRFHKSNLSLPSINSLPLKIVVWKGDAYSSALARLSDVQASKALGFGCFTGQSQKVGLLKDHISDTAPEKIKAVLNAFNASFETSYILTNAAAEDEIRNAAGELTTDTDQDPSVGVASIQNDDTPGPDQAAKALNEANLLKAKAAVDALAANAAKFRADQETYERGVREAAAAKARFDQSMAAYELELARTQAAQAEYQRKMEDHRKATGGR